MNWVFTCARFPVPTRSSVMGGVWLISRRGEIEHVFVGDASWPTLPPRSTAAGWGVVALKVACVWSIRTLERNETLTRGRSGRSWPFCDSIIRWRPSEFASPIPVARRDRASPFCFPRTRAARLRGSPGALPSAAFRQTAGSMRALVAASRRVNSERAAPSAVATRREDRALPVVVDVRRRGQVGGIRSEPRVERFSLEPPAERRAYV